MIDKKLPTDTKKLEDIAKNTDNPQLKRSIEKRIANDGKTVNK